MTAFAVGLVGIVAALVGAWLDPDQMLPGWLFAWHMFAGFSLGSLSLVLLHDVTGGRWGTCARPVFWCAARVMPWLSVMFVVPLLGVHHLYTWAGVVAPEGKSGYLNVPFWTVRSVVWLALFSWGSVRMASPLPDPRDGRSGFGLTVYVFAVSFAAIDWCMSLEASWYSTVYGLFFVVANALVALALAIVVLRRAPARFHDLGGLMLALVMLLAYLEFSQWVIVWSGNKPDEISWYLHRIEHGWAWPALVMLLFGLFAPFLALVFGSNKRNPATLARIAGAVILFTAVHYFWWIVPARRPVAAVTWTDLAALAGIGGIWTGMFLRNLAATPDPPREGEAP